MKSKKSSIVSAVRPEAPIGAWPIPGGFSFRVWAPDVAAVELVLEHPGLPRTIPMRRVRGGYHTLALPGVAPGALYRYRLDGAGPFPDPASRCQPKGVHGPSEAIDSAAFPWSADRRSALALDRLVVMELHVGTATSEGTFDALARRLAHYRGLGVTAVELMPVSACPGLRNWGYDGVSLYAPSSVYGGPAGLRRFVDTAHQLGLSVLLDVVYNHLGPDGNYLGLYARGYFTPAQTPWGQAVDFRLRPVRDFVIWNALHWLHEYRIDGLRLDATHAMVEPGTPHILTELSTRVRHSVRRGRSALLIAEDGRNDSRLVRSTACGGLGLDAVWADDLHHQAHVATTAERDGYYADYSGSPSDLARTLERGWFYSGQLSRYQGRRRGSSSAGLPVSSFIHCLQNHDQVGNRAEGERLHDLCGLAGWRAMSTLLLLSPYPPLLFMGQEWACTSPFLYFTDHEPGLGRLVTEGRRREFSRFKGFRGSGARRQIPDPQAVETFLRSKLDWAEQDESPHAEVLALYRELLTLRAALIAPAASVSRRCEAASVGRKAIALRRPGPDGTWLVVVNLGGRLKLDLLALRMTRPPRRSGWSLLFSSEEARFGGEADSVSLTNDGRNLRIAGAAAAVLRAQPHRANSGEDWRVKL